MAETGTVAYAFFAFRKRDRRFALTTTAIAYIVGSLALMAILLAAAWPHFSALGAWYLQVMRSASTGGEPPAPPAEALMGVAPYYALISVAGLVLYAAFEAACLRWMLRGERGGLFGLSLGADTWRVVATYVVWFGIALAFCLVVGLFYLALRGLGQAIPGIGIFTMILGGLGPLGFLALMLWGAVRLSPAAAVSVARRKFSFSQAWKATHGQFWEMLGAFVIVIVAYIVVTTIVGLPVRGTIETATYSAMSGTADANSLFDSLREAFASPLMLALLAVYMLASVALSLVFYVVWFGVNARAVQAALDGAKITA